MEVQATIVVQRDDDDVELYIFGEAEPYCAGNRRGHPDNWTPDEGGAVCVEGIFLDEDAKERWEGKLTNKEEAEAEEALMHQLEEELRDRAETAAEAKAEAMLDDWDYNDYGDRGPDIYDF